MIIKKRARSVEILKLEALARRLTVTHPKYSIVVENLYKKKAGYRGEESIDYYLKFISEDRYYILEDLRLQDDKGYFQIDVLVVSTSFILILEVKNISGTLVFDPQFNQLIRVAEDKEEAFLDPILQVEMQKQRLLKWLQTNLNTPKFPLESLVIISNPSTIIKATSKPHLIAQKVIRSANLPSKMTSYEQIYSSEILSSKEVRKMAKQLSKKHEAANVSILEQYEINKSDLIKGVQCPLCKYIPIIRQHGRWFCPSCTHTAKDLHRSALNDYSLLISSVATNQEIKEYLCLSSSATVRRLLHEFTFTGLKKDRKYTLTFHL
ncbi:nuclease-related domain-containing protein [Bacillus sp. AK128]